MTPGSRRRHTSASSSSSATQIGPSASFSTGCAPRGSTTRRSLLGAVRPVDGSVTIPDQDGEPITRELGSLLAERRRALAEQVGLFGTGGWDDVYALGADPVLLGAKVDELRVVSDPKLRGRALLGSARQGAGVSPSYVTGRLEGVSPGQTLAVAVNGAIAAVTRSYGDGDAVAFSALVPESVLRAGDNDIEIFVARRGTTPPTVERLRTARR